MHNPHFSGLKHNKQTVKDFLDSAWDERSIVKLLSTKELTTETFNLPGKISDILDTNPQLSATLHDDLGFESSTLRDVQEMKVEGSALCLYGILNELVENAVENGYKATLSFEEGTYIWESGKRYTFAALVFFTKNNKPISIEQYIQLRFCIPFKITGSVGGLGMWLINDLLSKGGGFLKVNLERDWAKRMERIEDYRSGLEVMVCFPKSQ